MNKILLLFIALIYTGNIMNAQSAKLNNITKFKVVNSGAIMDNNNDVDGYYFFYQVDKLKKGKREYAIQILDNDLHIVATKKIIDSKRTVLAASAYNNKEILFLFINFKEKQYRLVGFDKDGNKSRDKKIAINKKEYKWLYAMQNIGYGDLLLPIDNKGFILTTIVKNKKLGYKMQFLSSDKELKPWHLYSPGQAKKILSLQPIKTNDKYIVALEISKKSRQSKKNNISVLTIDVSNGKILFKRPYTKEQNPRLVTNSFIDNDEIVLLGEYFNVGDNIFTKKSQGLFVARTDINGKLISENKTSWENHLFKKLRQKNKKAKKRTYVYFHDVVKTKDGGYYAVGEMYKKTASAAGILGMAAMIATGGGVQSSMPLTQLTITDAVVYHFDDEFNLTDLKVFKKGKSRAPSVSDFGSPQLNAHVLNAYGAFDFINLQIDETNDRFYANFLDYNRFDEEKKGELSFISIIYDQGQLTKDQVSIKKQRRHIIRAFPAKLGHVMILDYNKKEKSINVHLEKMNIE